MIEAHDADRHLIPSFPLPLPPPAPITTPFLPFIIFSFPLFALFGSFEPK